MGCSAAALASTHLLPIAAGPAPTRTVKNVSRHRRYPLMGKTAPSDNYSSESFLPGTFQALQTQQHLLGLWGLMWGICTELFPLFYVPFSPPLAVRLRHPGGALSESSADSP